MTAEASAFLTPEQVAQRTGLSRKAIYRAIDRGQLTAYRLCGRLRIRTEDEHDWIEQSRVTPNKPARSRASVDVRPRPAPVEHSLHRLLEQQPRSTGLVRTQSYDQTPDSDKKRPGDALDVPGPAPGGTLDA